MQKKNRENLCEKVTQELLVMIRDKQIFKPGDQLPNEIVLAEQMGISRTTLREAENNLVSMNILKKHRGKGTFVTDPADRGHQEELDSLNYYQSRLAALYELRLMMEPSMAGLAAARATQAELDVIENLNRRIEKEDLTQEEIMELNRQFHNAIIRASHNEVMIRIYENISNAIFNYFKVSPKEDVRTIDMMLSHNLITQNMKLRDETGTREAMRLHLRSTISDFHIEDEENDG